MTAIEMGRTEEAVPSTLFELSGVRRVYRTGGGEVAALDGIDLTIDTGEFLAVEGPSGSGKSTLLQLLGALDRPSSGSLLFDSWELSRLNDRAVTRVRCRDIGFVFQAFNLVPTLSAAENVEAAMVPLNGGRRSRRSRAAELLDRVGLANRAHHLPSRLSGGEQQRVAIARAMANEPRVILADEPTGNLDAENEDRVLRLLRDLHAAGHTLVIVTHNTRIANLADRRVDLPHARLADLTVTREEIERRYAVVLVQMWSLAEDGRVPEAQRVKVPDVVDNRRTLLGMAESGLIFQPGETLEFTPRGRSRARDLVRRRRLAEVLFSSAMHLSDPEVEVAACRMEHIIDPEVTNSICSFLGHPRQCPHGRPIPAGDCCELPIIS